MTEQDSFSKICISVVTHSCAKYPIKSESIKAKCLINLMQTLVFFIETCRKNYQIKWLGYFTIK